MTRHQNKGLRKVCNCPRRTWAKCPHPWHFNFKWNHVAYRFSLDKYADTHLDSKTAAEDVAAALRIEIKAGRFGQPTPREEMTLAQLVNVYLERYVAVEHAATADDFRSGLRVICRTRLPHPTGDTTPLGDWRVADIVTDTIERYREARHATGTGAGGTNRSLSRLRAVFNWAVKLGYCDRTPFERHSKTVVKLAKEHPRSRRLEADEESALLAVCGPHLRAVVEAALQTGMRLGEILGLQWHQIEGLTVQDTVCTWAPRAALVLPWAKTKTRTARRIPISTRLKAILEMRRFDPAGQPLPMHAYVFGTAIGTRVTCIKRAWATAVLKAHEITATYTTTMNLSAESRAALAEINLHVHDLRREAGSRWMDGGVPLATIQRWLGHANVSQTSTYLAGTSASEHDALRQYEERQAALQRMATGAKQGGESDHERPEGRTETPNKTAVGREPAIM